MWSLNPLSGQPRPYWLLTSLAPRLASRLSAQSVQKTNSVPSDPLLQEQMGSSAVPKAVSAQTPRPPSSKEVWACTEESCSQTGGRIWSLASLFKWLRCQELHKGPPHKKALRTKENPAPHESPKARKNVMIAPANSLSWGCTCFGARHMVRETK